MAALDAGYDIKASGVTLDRFCGSGITAVNLAAAQIMSGMEDLVIAGGTEMMSYTRSTADPTSPPMMDNGNLRLRAKHPQSHQGVCADAIATLEGITREDVDALPWKARSAPTTPSRTATSTRASCRSITRTARLALDKEEFPRPSTTAEGLAASEAVLRRHGRRPARRQGHHLRRPDPEKHPDLEDQPHPPRR